MQGKSPSRGNIVKCTKNQGHSMDIEDFTVTKDGYALLSNHLMEALGQELVSAQFLDEIPVERLYQQLNLPGGQSVKFTKWGPNAEKLFFIILCTGGDENTKVLEFDISNVVFRNNRFTWHLRPPHNPISKSFLNNELGETVKTDSDYQERVKDNKRTLQSGENTVVTGHEFLSGVTLAELTVQFCRLVKLTIDWHETRGLSDDSSGNDSGGDPTGVAQEIENDDLTSYALCQRNVRLHQGPFKNGLMNRYNGRCVVTGCEVRQLLIAAHIKDHAVCGINSLDNGLLLKTDIHTLFDSGLLQIDIDRNSPTDTLLVTVRDELLSDPVYRELNNKSINFSSADLMPNKKYLKWKFNKHK